MRPVCGEQVILAWIESTLGANARETGGECNFHVLKAETACQDLILGDML